MSKNVLVLTDVREGELRNVSLESLAAATAVAEGGTVTAAVFGSKGQELVENWLIMGRCTASFECRMNSWTHTPPMLTSRHLSK